MKKIPSNELLALNIFRQAEASVLTAGYLWEIEWQRNRSFDSFCEEEFLREAAWVVLCAGFRESAVRERFDYISLCFCDWESAKEIVARRDACIGTALSGFRNRRKLEAIVGIAEKINACGFNSFRAAVLQDPIEELRLLPYIGPITSWHLAKNLGLDVAKNDRHLARIAQHCGYSDAHVLCNVLSQATGHARSVVDVILWRFLVLNPKQRMHAPEPLQIG